MPLSIAEQAELNSCGIRFISKNALESLLVTGSGNPENISVLELPSFVPKMILKGHKDWVFSCEFIAPTRLASAGRDCSVRAWDISPESDKQEICERKPLFTRKEHSKKVRDLKYNRHTNMFATLSSDNYIKCWDANNFDVVRPVSN